jgi:hypothetical protein
MTDRIATLQADYMANKPWYVHSASRTSAEEILYSQGKVSGSLLHAQKEHNCFQKKKKKKKNIVSKCRVDFDVDIHSIDFISF